MTEKWVGYSLLGVGLLIIVLAAFSVYQVFFGGAKPVQIFDFPAIGLSVSDLVSQPIPGVATGPNAPKAELIPASVLNDTSNVIAHLLLMGFMVSVGSKIASLGVNLVRPIVVKSSKNV